MALDGSRHGLGLGCFKTEALRTEAGSAEQTCLVLPFQLDFDMGRTRFNVPTEPVPDDTSSGNKSVAGGAYERPGVCGCT